MTRFESLKIGDSATLEHTITTSDVSKFIDLCGDDNKLHFDEEYAKKTHFKKPVVHGMLGASFISTIIGTKLPGDGALWFSQNLEYLLPVRVGDRLTISAKVLRKRERDHVVELETNIFNQHKQKVTAGIAKVKIVEEETSVFPEKEEKKAQIALVVGASGGIGEATCYALAKKGFDIVIHYHHNKERAKKIKLEVAGLQRKAAIVQADITDAKSMQDMVTEIERTFNAVTAVINCTTVKIPAIRFQAMEWDDIKNHIDINVKGTFNMVKYILPLMEREKRGAIVTITTQYVETPKSELLHYVTAKSALQGFSKALALELAPKGITVNMVSPSMTETDLISDIPEKMRLLTAAKTPLKRLARPQDVANAVAFLVSHETSFITGETIRVNGGQVMV